MKLNTNAMPVEHIGVVSESKSFSIKSTGKAFQVLSSKLYKNKIAAIIRELSTNAYDSHLSAGRGDLPFDVHLPTMFEPYFSVRDYGTGLSDHDVKNVFTTFFESTKEDSNEQIGGLGLGSKTPFSYVDSFSVYSYLDGRRTSYECFLENGTPMISPKANTASNSDNGLEITMAVKPEDIHRFAQEALTIYRYFNLRPNFTGAQIEVRDAPEMRGSCWGLSDNLEAVMGQIRYPLSREIAGVALHGLCVHFPIGELDIQAGREELSYDKTTVAAIQSRMMLVRTEIEAIYEKLFRGCENVIDACLRVRENPDKLYEILTPSFRGTPINGRSFTAAFGNHGRADTFGIFPDPKVKKISARDLTIFVMDVEKTSGTRYNIWRQTNPTAWGLKVQTAYGNHAGSLAGIMTAVGDLTHVLASSIPLPPKKAKLRVLGMDSTKSIRDQPEKTVDLNAGGVYLVSKNQQAIHPRDNDKVLTNETMMSIHNVVLNLFSDIGEVAIVPWSRRGEMGEEGWSNIYDLMRAKYEGFRRNKSFIATCERSEAFRSFAPIQSNMSFHQMVALNDYLAPDCPLRAFLLEWQACKAAYDTHDQWRVYAEVFRGRTYVKNNRLNNMWNNISNKLPVIVDAYSGRGRTINNIVARDYAVYVDAKLSKLALAV